MLSPSEIAPDKVAVYIRWSTDDQGEGTTLETQLERCRHFVASQGWRYDDSLVYVDDGWSGGTLDRPALTRLRQDVEQQKVQCVVVYKIDRLSRSVVDIVDLVLREWEGRCFVKSTTEEVNTLTPAGKMFFYILVSFAEYERNVIRERTMSGKIKRAEQGLNPGFRPPYGYARGSRPGEVVVVAHEAGVVRRIFARYRQGTGVHRIARELNEEGVRRRGQPWNPLTIRRILGNEAYIGVLTYGKSMRTSREQQERQGRKRTVRFDQPRYARVEGAFPAIVEREEWEAVQRLLRARSARHRASASRPTYGDYLLSGLAVCRCGAPIHGKAAGRGRYYYYCSARKRRGRAACDAGHIPVEPVNAAIARRVRAVLSTLGWGESAEVLEEAVSARLADARAALEAEQARRRALEERARRLAGDYRRGELPARLYANELAELEAEQADVARRIGALEAEVAAVEAAGGDREALLGALERMDIWDELNVPERRRLLQELTVSVVLYRPSRSQQPPELAIDWVRLSQRGFG